MLATLQLDMLVDGDADAVIARTRATGILPLMSESAAFTDAQQIDLCQAFLHGSRAAADRIAAGKRAAFADQGWAFRWFQEWKPASQAGEALADALDEALDVVERCYQPILDRGLGHSEDLGILQQKTWGGAEGIQVKRDPYGSLVLVSVYCVTGPSNLDAVTGEIEFEKGSRSHVLHLLYRDLPSKTRLLGDLAAYPVLKLPSNLDANSPQGGSWCGEGWTGPSQTRPRLHHPWDTIPGPPA
jgi:hypothetical protein